MKTQLSLFDEVFYVPGVLGLQSIAMHAGFVDVERWEDKRQELQQEQDRRLESHPEGLLPVICGNPARTTRNRRECLGILSGKLIMTTISRIEMNLGIYYRYNKILNLIIS